jgi:hypothetical protein
MQDLQSPLRGLLIHFNEAHFRLAPEREDELRHLLSERNVNFRFNPTHLDMVFEGVSLFGRLGLVHLGLRGLERLWVHSLAAIPLGQNARMAGSTTICALNWICSCGAGVFNLAR